MKSPLGSIPGWRASIGDHILLLVLLLAVAATCTAASSNERQRPTSARTIHSAANEQRGTAREPLVVGGEIVTKKAASEAEGDAEERRAKALLDHDLVRYTLWLTVCTALLFAAAAIQAGLFIWQLSLIKASAVDAKAMAEAARDAAQAAKASADSVVSAERAYIFAELPTLPGGLVSTQTSGFPNIIGIKYWNYGKTPAEVIQIRGYPHVQDVDAPAPSDLIEYDGSERMLPPGMGIATNSSYEDSYTFRPNDDDIKALNTWAKKLFVVGRITYNDIFGKKQVTSFCWELLIHIGEYKFIPNRASLLNKRT